MIIVAHNITAVNTNRQLNITTSDKKKSTEKLSIQAATSESRGLGKNMIYGKDKTTTLIWSPSNSLNSEIQLYQGNAIHFGFNYGISETNPRPPMVPPDPSPLEEWVLVPDPDADPIEVPISGQSMLAQANNMNQSVLQLLQ